MQDNYIYMLMQLMKLMVNIPKLLFFNMFRFGREVAIDFNMEDMNEAIDWMVNTIDDIKQCDEFPVTKDKFFW